MTLNEILKKEKDRVGWTGKELAEKMGVKPASVSRWLSGKDTPTLENLQKLSELLKVSISHLLGESCMLPLLSWVKAGDFADALPFSYDTIEVPMLIRRPDCFVLQVRGNSMSRPEGKSYFDGCYVVVDPHFDPAPDMLLHKVVIAQTSEGVTIKEYILEGDKPRLHPWNPAYHDLEVTEDTVIIGEVIKMFC